MLNRQAQRFLRNVLYLYLKSYAFSCDIRTYKRCETNKTSSAPSTKVAPLSDEDKQVANNSSVSSQ